MAYYYVSIGCGDGDIETPYSIDHVVGYDDAKLDNKQGAMERKYQISIDQ